MALLLGIVAGCRRVKTVPHWLKLQYRSIDGCSNFYHLKDVSMKPYRRIALTLVAAAWLVTGSAWAQQRLFFGVATGGTGGTYYPLGGMLAQLISNKASVDGKK